MDRGLSYRSTALAVIAFAVAMAYLEAAVVVYLQGTLGAAVGQIFPIPSAIEFGNLEQIELGREVATIVMIGAIGMLVGRTSLERLAWAAVVFGVWDIGYYAWLQVFSGWPGSLTTVDLLFLVPVPWVGPVWSPIVVSCALVGFGLTAASALRARRTMAIRPRHWIAGLVGGLLVVASYTVESGDLLQGGLPRPYPWPLFVVGVGVAAWAALDALRQATSPGATTSSSAPLDSPNAAGPG